VLDELRDFLKISFESLGLAVFLSLLGVFYDMFTRVFLF